MAKENCYWLRSIGLGNCLSSVIFRLIFINPSLKCEYRDLNIAFFSFSALFSFDQVKKNLIARNVSNALSLLYKLNIIRQHYNYQKVPPMQAEHHDPYFLLFERRRLKVTEAHRTRREQLFNKSRNILTDELDNLNLEARNSQSSVLNSETKTEQEDESSLNDENAFDSAFTVEVEQNEVLNVKDLEEKSNQIEEIEGNTKEVEAAHNKGSSKLKKYPKKKRNFSKAIQVPSWMNTVPEDLSQFYGMARPNGKTGLLVIEQGWLTIHDKYGKQISINKFAGSAENQGLLKKICQQFHDTIFEIIFCEQTKIIYIMDLISWKRTIMAAENFQFRYAWLLANVGQLVACNFVGFGIRLAQYFLMANVEGLKKIYSQDFGYQKEGLLFVQKDSPYIHGYNENAMIWKDHQTSKYPIDEYTKPMQEEGEGKTKPDYIYGMGKVTRSGNIFSLDGYKLGHLDPSIIPAFTGGYVRYKITSVKFNGQEGDSNTMKAEGEGEMDAGMKIDLKDFEVIQYRRYGRAEPLSRVIFQYRIRHDPLTIEQIASRIPHN